VTGHADFELVSTAYAKRAGWKAVSFTNEMPAALACSSAVISRAGASTLAEITATGRPSILTPYPYDRHKHQNDNAAALAEAGAAVVIEDRLDRKANAAALKDPLQALLGDEGKRVQMAAASRRIGRPDAAQRVAEDLVAMAQEHKR
jgi:UDP-N-acetylglucosamine--N-acetylmuramyl-(pentapeptide) pyrophosphoryl-undecaprenol N-acetylglucosamine transferase